MRVPSRSFRWSIVALSGILLSATAAVSSAVTITGPVGANNQSSTFWAFVTGSDANLWLRSSAGTWTDLSHPSGVSIAHSAGAITRGGDPFEFIVGSDGNLWLNNYNGSSWVWTNMGTPSGVAISQAIGSVTSGGEPFAFVIGNDGNVWQKHYTGSAWVWTNMGKPTGGASISMGLGALATTAGDPFAFVLASDGSIWLSEFNGSAYVWTNLGSETFGGVGSSIGAIAIGLRPITYFISSGGALLATEDVDGSGSTSVIGTPAAGVTCAKGVGIATNISEYPVVIYVIGSNGHLYSATATGTIGWSWADLGLPSSGLGLDIPVGVTANALAFQTDTAGTLWEWNGSSYVNLGVP